MALSAPCPSTCGEQSRDMCRLGERRPSSAPEVQHSKLWERSCDLKYCPPVGEQIALRGRGAEAVAAWAQGPVHRNKQRIRGLEGRAVSRLDIDNLERRCLLPKLSGDANA